MESRPRIQPELTAFDKAIELTGWIALAGIWVLTIFSFTNLPDIIPIHFNLQGEADNYGAKGTIFLMPIIASIISIGFTALNRYPHLFNYANRINKGNAVRQYTNATRMLRSLKLSIIIVFGLIVINTNLYVHAESYTFGLWMLIISLALIFIPMVYYLIKILRG